MTNNNDNLQEVEKALLGSAKIDPKKALLESLFKVYVENCDEITNIKFHRNLNHKTLFKTLSQTRNIKNWLKIEKRELQKVIFIKKKKNIKTIKEEKYLKIVESFLKKIKKDSQQNRNLF